MSIKRPYIAEFLNIEEEAVRCENCAARKKICDSYMFCKMWQSSVVPNAFCTFFEVSKKNKRKEK